jgi:hypothetical protein
MLDKLEVLLLLDHTLGAEYGHYTVVFFTILLSKTKANNLFIGVLGHIENN